MRKDTRLARHAAAVLLLCGAALLVDGRAAAAPPPTPEAFAEQDAGEWLWPVEGQRRVVERFRAPADAYAAGHRGMDIAALDHDEVRAPANGVVAFRGVVVDRLLITIDHGSGLVTTFEPVDSILSPGDAVAAGEVIGTVATGGHSAERTLHVGVRLHGTYIDPLPLFAEVARAVLLPCCASP